MLDLVSISAVLAFVPGLGSAAEIELIGPAAAAMSPGAAARRVLRPGVRAFRLVRDSAAKSARALGVTAKADAVASAPAPVLPETLVALHSREGGALLYGAGARADFLPLSLHFITQESRAYCGPATMAMLLNALDLPRPPSAETLGHGLFDQKNVFTPAVEAIKPRHRVAREGMSLRDFAAALGAHGVKVTLRYAQDTDLEAFRAEARAVLEEERRYVAVNYLRDALGQVSGGHTSPLAAYDARTDRFLILDVARYRYPPIWVEAAALFEAMAVKTGGGVSRGYVIVER